MVILCFIVCISADISLPDFYTDSDLVFHKLAQRELIKQKKEKSRKGKVASEKPSLSKKSIKKSIISESGNIKWPKEASSKKSNFSATPDIQPQRDAKYSPHNKLSLKCPIARCLRKQSETLFKLTKAYIKWCGYFESRLLEGPTVPHHSPHTLLQCLP